ncbi:ABC transporter ATP-binding protein [Paenibacillus turpanensis]|uniref:ABC transporter ATP-binding protein n=1 Tax=Paenibacillus turpanensis TaxID=2689078 RepID=UPI00140A2F5F|nr:ABC transporter ATP-binding protein [Paenibacillus turpanensis]
MPVLEISGVSKRFGGIQAAQRIEAAVDHGSITTVIGPNGAGKTTLFNLITGIYKPDSGRIELEGKSLIGVRPDRIAARGIARTFQSIRLFGKLSVLDNVLVGMHIQLKAGLAGILCRLPAVQREEEAARREAFRILDHFGLASLLNENAENLSYGAQRRLEIARAMASKPKLLLLDEPAAGMNPKETAQLADLIRSIRDDLGITILLIEHDMKFVMSLSDHLIVLDHGETIAAGTADDIRRNPKVIEAYLGTSAAALDSGQGRKRHGLTGT